MAIESKEEIILAQLKRLNDEVDEAKKELKEAEGKPADDNQRETVRWYRSVIDGLNDRRKVLEEALCRGSAGASSAGTSGAGVPKSVAISRVTSHIWANINKNLHGDSSAQPVFVVQPPLCVPPAPDTAAFVWTDAVEGAAEHSTAANEWLNKNISAPPQHEWVDCTKSKSFLDCRLPGAGVALKGSTDLALCTSAATKGNSAQSGLRIVVELKKEPAERTPWQLITELLAANIRSPLFKPIAVMTDLGDNWRLAWIDQKQVKVYICTGRPEAVGILRAFLEKERLTPDCAGIAQLAEEAGIDAAELDPGGLLKRRRLQLGTAPRDVANLDDLLDLADDLGEHDMHQITCQALLQNMLEQQQPGSAAPAVVGDVPALPPATMFP
ncbi:hypothetical protein HXX76_000347 [Chlamydomonas incerta]|uniref:Uncharacterized protein n=1 Tax=Chlamydomonas incerta TaxID=51695 RepID=A0A835WEF2_CHLIN|nr:hypothetical protein HXX76_000347 [Chlamydomonas incerta]|eukprot:KAG2445741.1 hypothetical protein HXX76_000347 [Chlamydomonas incerta]